MIIDCFFFFVIMIFLPYIKILRISSIELLKSKCLTIQPAEIYCVFAIRQFLYFNFFLISRHEKHLFFFASHWKFSRVMINYYEIFGLKQNKTHRPRS